VGRSAAGAGAGAGAGGTSIGIVVGAIAGAILVIGAAVLLARRRGRGDGPISGQDPAG